MHKILFNGSRQAGKVFGITAVSITLAIGFAFLIGQQLLRMGANDPQVEIIEGISEALGLGQDPAAFSSLNPTDIAKSLSPFVIIYDSQGKVVSGTGQLDGQAPTPPSAVFDIAKAKGQHRLTWEPKKGIRSAVVIKEYKAGETSGFALVGKSLREVELRTKTLLKFSGIAWAIALVVSMLAVNLLFARKEEHDHSHDGHLHDHEHHSHS